MFKGQFSPAVFYFTGASLAISSIFIIYWQSQYYEQEPPFPHQWISKVAQHYPQFIVFRTGTITGAALLVLGWMTNHFFLQTVARENGINLKKFYPQIPLILGIMGGLLLMGNTATIDTGVMNGKLHGFCASKFFILTFIAQIYNTVIVTIFYRKTKAISLWNLYLKYFILLMLVLQAIDASIKGEGLIVGGKDKDKFLEWTMTATVISMFLSIGADVLPFELVYVEEGKESQHVTELSPTDQILPVI